MKLVSSPLGPTFVGGWHYIACCLANDIHCFVELAGERNIGISGPVTWSEVIGCLPLLIITSCAVNCSLPSILHGLALHNSFHNLLPLGTTVHVYCFLGYVVDGPNNITCGEQGWDDLPSCKSKYQSPLPSPPLPSPPLPSPPLPSPPLPSPPLAFTPCTSLPSSPSQCPQQKFPPLLH